MKTPDDWYRFALGVDRERPRHRSARKRNELTSLQCAPG
jgi:hypothetical protein